MCFANNTLSAKIIATKISPKFIIKLAGLSLKIFPEDIQLSALNSSSYTKQSYTNEYSLCTRVPFLPSQ